MRPSRARAPLTRRILAVLVAAVSCTVPAALSQPTVQVLDTAVVARCHYYGFFPSVHLLSTGELICAVKMDADAHHVEGNFWGYMISRDGGRTWGMRNTAGMVYKGEAAYSRIPRPDGTLRMLAGYALPGGGTDYQHLEGVSVEIADRGQSIHLRRDVRIELPKPSFRKKLDTKIVNFASLGPGKLEESGFVFFSGSILDGRPGELLTTMYGKLDGDRYMRAFVARSDPAGKSWSYLKTIGGDAEAVVLEGEKRTEGFTEPRMIRLGDGRLLAVMRRGSDNLMYRCWSSDDGRTWTKPESIGFRGVKPALWLMKNGLLALSTGRPDPVSLYLSPDGGQTWSSPTVLFREPGTRYTDLIEIAPDELLVVYDHVPFDWGVIPDEHPEAMNTVYCARIAVKRR